MDQTGQRYGIHFHLHHITLRRRPPNHGCIDHLVVDMGRSLYLRTSHRCPVLPLVKSTVSLICRHPQVPSNPTSKSVSKLARHG